MKSAVLLALALCAVFPAAAQEDADARERARIATERGAVEARFAERKTACNALFAVTDCVEKAARERNTALADLRRQERILNDAERRRRAAERLKAQEERKEPQGAEAERRARALEEQKEREARAAEKAEKRAAEQAERASAPRRAKSFSGPAGPQGSARAPREPKGPTVTAEEAAKNRAAHEARLREAELHKAEVRERLANHAKPAASGLPVPK